MDDERALKGCLGKRAFDTRKAARETAGRVRDFAGKGQRPYKCRNCHAYHLTSRTKEVDRSFRRYVRGDETTRG